MGNQIRAAVDMYSRAAREFIVRGGALRRAAIFGVAFFLFAATALALATKIWEFDGRTLRNYTLRYECQRNLRDIGYALWDYTSVVKGEKFPSIPAVAGILMFQQADMEPYVPTWNALACPAPIRDIPENTYDDAYYVYTGYLLTNDEDVEAFAGAYAAQLSAGGNFEDNLDVESSYGDSLFHLRRGIERFLITDINNPGNWNLPADIAVLWDWPDNHPQGWGGNVLYMDGHVEWVAYPGEFPMTEATITALAEIAGYDPPAMWNNDPETAVDYPYMGESGSQLIAARSKISGLANAIRNFTYSNSGDLYPQMSDEANRLMMRASELYPEFTFDREIVNSPGVPHAVLPPFFDDQDYVYLGYLLTNDEDVQHFAAAYGDEIAAGGDFSSDLDHESSYGDTIFRLRNHIQRFFITDINDPGIPAQFDYLEAHVPVVIEWPDNYRGVSGGNVIYMDGHVGWLEYPGEFPMTEATISTLRALAEVPEKTEWLPPADPEAAQAADPYGFVGRCYSQMRTNAFAAIWYGDYYSADGSYPKLPVEAGRLMYGEELFPDNLSDPTTLVCPGTGVETPARFFDDQHYAYLGYALLTDSDVVAFAAAYTVDLAGGGDLSGDLDVPSSYADTVLRLRENVTDGFNTPPGTPLQDVITEYDIPVMIEWPGNHEGRTGGHVAYMDGHVEWHDYPGDFPMTETAITTLGVLAGWSPVTSWPQLQLYLPGDPYNQGTCNANLSTIGLAMLLFEIENNGFFYPKLSCTPNNLMFDDEPFIEHYLLDPRRANCPGSAVVYRQPSLTDHSYAYLGYAVYDQASLEHFATAYNETLAGGGEFTEDLMAGDEPVYRLSDGVFWAHLRPVSLEPVPALFGEQDIPVLIEWPDNHGDIRGGHVLYLDRHREWVDYPGKFPMTEAAMAALTDLAGREPIRGAAPPRAQTRLDGLLQQGGGSSRR